MRFFCSSLVSLGMIFSLAAGGVAYGQSWRDNVLSSDEIRAELFGISLSGKTGYARLPWQECIQTDGLTDYSFGGLRTHGQASVSESDQLCFKYAIENFEKSYCFKVSRRAENYVFWGGSNTSGNGIFISTKVERHIDKCDIINQALIYEGDTIPTPTEP